MHRRRALVGVVLALAAACSAPAVDDALPPAPPTTAATTTTAAPTSTTTPVPADLADLAATATMTERARRLFFAASPAIEDPETFTRSCGLVASADSPGEPRTHTQGCYVAGRIHLLSPDRAEARDLLSVVAAHELLHVVYANLGPDERARVDAELEAARVGNQRLEERLRPYGTGPTLTNEVHSILGSGFADLSPALEAHYAQFFADRAELVAARQRTLGIREEEISRLRAEIDDLGARIAALKDGQEELRASGDLGTHNANVAVINGLISRFNASIQALNAQVEEYNGLLGA